VPHQAPAYGSPDWLSDFLNHLGKTENERNANAGLRINLNASPKATAAASPR